MAPGRGGKHVSLGAGKFIIPSDPKGFQDPKYWDQFFASRNSAFEWYGNFLESAEVLCRYIKAKDDILVIGSGNSELSGEMYYTGLKKITNMDISQVVIDRMTKKYKDICPDMKFVRDDVTKMSTIKDESFSVVLDKATFDALVADDSHVSEEMADKICSEVDRVLKHGGRYICVTLAQKHVLNQLVQNMANKGYAVRAHVISVDNPEQPHDVVFCFVFTKMKPGFPLILDMQLGQADKLTRCETVAQFLRRVKEHQHVQSVARCLKLGRYEVVEGEQVKIFDSKGTHLYTLYPFKPSIRKPRFGATCFIIPPGRSKSYLYGTHEGRKEVSQNISAQLVMFADVVGASKGIFSFHSVKDDLTPYMRNFCPSKLFESLVFLSDGDFPEVTEQTTGDEVIYEGTSPSTGPYRVLQRPVAGNSFYLERRLIFENSPSVIQTEMRLQKPLPGSGSPLPILDREYLPSDYQRCIVAAVLNHRKLAAPVQEDTKILLVGLGGGILTSYLHQVFPTSIVEAVEIDPAVVEIALKYFGLQISNRCAVHVADGLDFLKQAETGEEKYDIVIIDADTKDPKLPLRCPPAEFVSISVLRTINHLLNRDGMLIVNILSRQVCGDWEIVCHPLRKLSSAATSVRNNITNVFGNTLYMNPVDDDLNTIAVALRENYYPPDCGGECLENSLRSKSKEALSYWLENLRCFNQMMDERTGEVLLDGPMWWRRVDVNFSIPFLIGCTLQEYVDEHIAATSEQNGQEADSPDTTTTAA